MTFKVTIIYGVPDDPGHFEEYYSGPHAAISAEPKGTMRSERSKVVETVRGEEGQIYRLAEAWFADRKEMDTVMRSSAMRASLEDLDRFSTGGTTIIVSEIG